MPETDSQEAALADQLPESVDALIAHLEQHQYLANQGFATALFLALKLQKPLLIEGIAGCGKTEVARTLAPMLQTQLIRLQCYEGISTNEALYDWDYSRQLLHLRAAQGNDTSSAQSSSELASDLYCEQYLLERPLLSALRQHRSPVLLLDELDRADTDFEAFLLEFLEEFQVTVPEIGSIKASHPPVVIITSNRTRELHDALKRRCIYYWMDLPDRAFEEKIIRLRLPDVDAKLATQVAKALEAIRKMDLVKHPGSSEALDWARALTMLKAGEEPTVDDFKSTLSVVLKDEADHVTVLEGFDQIISAS